MRYAIVNHTHISGFKKKKCTFVFQLLQKKVDALNENWNSSLFCKQIDYEPTKQIDYGPTKQIDHRPTFPL